MFWTRDAKLTSRKPRKARVSTPLHYPKLWSERHFMGNALVAICHVALVRESRFVTAVDVRSKRFPVSFCTSTVQQCQRSNNRTRRLKLDTGRQVRRQPAFSEQVKSIICVHMNSKSVYSPHWRNKAHNVIICHHPNVAQHHQNGLLPKAWQLMSSLC